VNRLEHRSLYPPRSYLFLRNEGRPRPPLSGSTFARLGVKSTPALVRTGLGVDRLDARRGLVRHQGRAGIEEILAFRWRRLFAGVREFLDRLDAHRGHQQRILLRGRADNAFSDVLDA